MNKSKTASQYEQLIEYILNDENDKARALFHDIVVEKSRDIYESIMDEESMEETVHGAQVEDMVDELADEEAAMEDEEFDLDHEEGDEIGGELPAHDDVEGSDEFGGDEAEHEEIEDAVVRIEDKLDKRK